MKLDSIETRENLVDFIEGLEFDFVKKPEDWKNSDFASFLKAAAVYIRAMDSVYMKKGEKFPEQPSWKMLASILYAAKFDK